MHLIPRFAALTAATTAGALLLTACGGSSGEQSAADEKQTLTVWGMGEEGKHLQKLGDEFEKKHPNITVKVTPVGWDVVHQKLVSAVAGGKLPDMAQMGSTMMGEFIALDVLEPVDTKTFNKSDFFPAAWDNNVKDGEAYGVPWYVDVRALYYRTDLAKKAGVKEPPGSWQEMQDLAAAYQDKAGTEWGASVQPANTGAWQTWITFFYSAGGTLLDDSGKPAFDTPEAVKAFEEYQSYFEKGLAKKSTQPGYDVTKDFGNGRVPMFISGPWIVNLLNDQHANIKGKWDVAPLPSDKSSTSWIGGSSLVTFSDSEHKAAAEKFTSWLTSTKKQADWFEMSSSLPANQASWNEPALQDAQGLDVFEQQLKTAKAVPPLEKWNEFSVKMDEAIARATQKGEDPEKTAAWLQKQTEGLVN